MKKPEAGATRKPAVDMAPDAIAQRLRDVDELLQLALSLQSARRIGPVPASAPRDTPPDADAGQSNNR